MNLEFAHNTSLLKRIAKTQMIADKEFAEESFRLRRELLSKKIAPLAWWESYQKALLKSVGKNKQLVQDLFKKVDKRMRRRIGEAEKEEKEVEETPKFPDLSLPK